MDIEIQRADTRLRRVTVVVLVLATIAAAGVIVLVHGWMIRRALASTPEQLLAQMRQWLGLASIACGLCLLLLAAHAWRRGRAAVAQRRWPVANARVLRDTPIRRDDAALGIARLLNLVSLMLLAFAVALIALSWRLFLVAH
jgi:hypothetical protein